MPEGSAEPAVPAGSACPYRELWCVDFEFQADGGLPIPLCMVAKEHRTGREIRLWRDALLKLRAPPFDIGEGSCLVAYVASAELGCFQALGWPLPAHVLDLAQEHKLSINTGRRGKAQVGWGLTDALRCRGLVHLMQDDKPEMIRLITSQASHTDCERDAILDYCATDVHGLHALLSAIWPHIDLPRAVRFRGRYMRAVSRMEHVGIPIDTASRERIMRVLPLVEAGLVARGDAVTRCYEDGRFSYARFHAFLARHDLEWERTDGGQARLDADYLKARADAHPALLRDFHELREVLSLLRSVRKGDHRLLPSSDGMLRCPLWPFGTATGRNAPRAIEFIFGPARWLRGLIKPPSGFAIAYIDWEQQEFALAGGLSGDPHMIADYASGDVYWSFAVSAGLIPPGVARKAKGQPKDDADHAHEAARDACKAVVLGLAYGKGWRSIARDAGLPVALAKTLHDAHKRRYARFWRWIDSVVARARLDGWIRNKYGWRQIVTGDTTDRSLMNFPMQAGGAAMMQLAAIAATERGLRVCAPIHDAFLIMAPLDGIEGAVAELQAIMREASVVVGGVAARTDAEIVRFPDRYMDKRGRSMWFKIAALIAEHEECQSVDMLFSTES